MKFKTAQVYLDLLLGEIPVTLGEGKRGSPATVWHKSSGCFLGCIALSKIKQPGDLVKALEPFWFTK